MNVLFVILYFFIIAAGYFETSASVDWQADVLYDLARRQHERDDARPSQGRVDVHFAARHARTRRARRTAHWHFVQKGHNKLMIFLLSRDRKRYCASFVLHWGKNIQISTFLPQLFCLRDSN